MLFDCISVAAFVLLTIHGFSTGIRGSTANSPPPGPEADETAAKPNKNVPGHPCKGDALGHFLAW